MKTFNDFKLHKETSWHNTKWKRISYFGKQLSFRHHKIYSKHYISTPLKGLSLFVILQHNRFAFQEMYADTLIHKPKLVLFKCKSYIKFPRTVVCDPMCKIPSHENHWTLHYLWNGMVSFLVNVYVVVKYLLSYFFAMSLITFTCSSITNDKKILINAKYRIPNLMSLNSVLFLFSFLVLCLFSFFLEGGAFNLADPIFKTCYLN